MPRLSKAEKERRAAEAAAANGGVAPAAPEAPSGVMAAFTAPKPAAPSPALVRDIAPWEPNNIVPSPSMFGQLEKVADLLIDSGAKPANLDTRAKIVVVLLKAWELGLPLLAASRQLFITNDGVIGMHAEAQRALIERSGKGYVQLEGPLNETAVTVIGVRYGLAGRPDRQTTVTYTMAELLNSGVTTPVKWPADQLFARATTRVSRALFSDVVSGVGYDPSELGGAPSPVASVLAPQAPPPAPPVAAPSPAAFPAPPVVPVAPPAATPPQVAPQSPPAPPAAAPPALPPTPAPAVPVAAPAAPTAVPPTPGVTLPALTHKVQIAQAGGGIQIVETAGITLELIQAISRLTMPAGGNPRHAELMAFGKQVLQGMGLGSTKYLTAEQGQSFLALLQKQDGILAGANGAPATPAVVVNGAPIPGQETNDQMLDALVANINHPSVRITRADLLSMILSGGQKASITEFTRPEMEQMVREIATLSHNDPQAFALVVDRYVGAQGRPPGAVA